MITIKFPDERVLSKYPPSHRVVAAVGNGVHSLSVVESLGMNGLCVLTVCNTPQGRPRYSRYSTGVWVLDASPYDPEFVDELEKLARQYNAGSVMTLSEANHLALVDARDRFEPDIHVFSPPTESLKNALNKDHVRMLCKKIGVPVAKGMLLADFLKDPGQTIQYPRILRTRNLHGDQGRSKAPWKVAYSTNEQEFNEYVKQVMHIADNVLVEEFHTGVCFNMGILMHEGRPFFSGAYYGEHHYPAAGGVTIQRVSCESGKPYEHAVQLLTALGWEGNAGVDFRYDMKTHDYIFTEINPRFEGATPTLVHAGFHIPYLLWQSHFEPDKMKKPRYRIGLRTREFKGTVGWLKDILRGSSLEPGRKQPSKIGAIATFLWHCGPWTKDDTFYWRDPLPYVMERLSMIIPNLMIWKKFVKKGHE
jgi:predicted ATP-grasp superfamily ATP-dependent carboligase